MIAHRGGVISNGPLQIRLEFPTGKPVLEVSYTNLGLGSAKPGGADTSHSHWAMEGFQMG